MQTGMTNVSQISFSQSYCGGGLRQSNIQERICSNHTTILLFCLVILCPSVWFQTSMCFSFVLGHPPNTHEYSMLQKAPSCILWHFIKLKKMCRSKLNLWARTQNSSTQLSHCLMAYWDKHKLE